MVRTTTSPKWTGPAGGEPATFARTRSSGTEHAALRHLARLLGRQAAQHETPANLAGAHGADPTKTDAIETGDLPRQLDSGGKDDGR